MTVYIDSDFRCHMSDTGWLIPVKTAFFDGKSARYIEGYRYIPAGESWTREDGVIFHGEMVSPAEDSRILEAAQEAYEQAQEENADMKAALEIMGVQP